MPHAVARPWLWVQRVVQLGVLLLVIPVSVTWMLPGLWWASLWWWRRRLQPGWYAAALIFLLLQTATLRQESWVWWLSLGLLWEGGQTLMEWLPFGGKRWWTLLWGVTWSAIVLWQWGGLENQQAWLALLLCALVWLLWQGKGWIRYGRE